EPPAAIQRIEVVQPDALHCAHEPIIYHDDAPTHEEEEVVMEVVVTPRAESLPAQVRTYSVDMTLNDTPAPAPAPAQPTDLRRTAEEILLEESDSEDSNLLPIVCAKAPARSSSQPAPAPELNR